MNDCMLRKKTCVDLNDDRVRYAISRLSIATGISNPTIRDLMLHFDVNCEMDLWNNKKVRGNIGDTAQHYILSTYFKVVNLNTINESVMNKDVNKVLYKWELNSRILFDKSVKFLIHNVLNFMKIPNEIRDLNIDELFKYDVVGFIYHIKLDGDEHMHVAAVYIDVIKKTILYFDALGGTPQPPLRYWFDKLILEINLKKGLTFTQINVVKTPIQIDDAQCNVWNLVFILSQLNGFKHEWILSLTYADIIGFKHMIFKHLQLKTYVDLNNTDVRHAISKISASIGKSNPTIKELMVHFNVNCEMDLWKSKKVRDIIGKDTQEFILTVYFKTVNKYGISDMVRYISLHETLLLWGMHSQKLFNKRIRFILQTKLKFIETPNKARDLNIDMMFKYDVIGFIHHIIHVGCNYGHAVAVYIDVIKKTILYFDTSGKVPEPQLQYWINKLILEIKLKKDLTFTQINVIKTSIQIESDDIQCTVWSIVFILSQLNGFNLEWISTLTYADIIGFKCMIFNHLQEFNTY